MIWNTAILPVPWLKALYPLESLKSGGFLDFEFAIGIELVSPTSRLLIWRFAQAKVVPLCPIAL